MTMTSNNSELRELLQHVHDGITSFNFDGKAVPCIVVGEKMYDMFISRTAGHSLLINTNLDVLHDGCGNVFVWITLLFSVGGIVEKFLVNARTDLEFFETLASTGMLAISKGSEYRETASDDSVIMVQLPRLDNAIKALEIIRGELVPRR